MDDIHKEIKVLVFKMLRYIFICSNYNKGAVFRVKKRAHIKDLIHKYLELRPNCRLENYFYRSTRFEFVG